MNNMKIDEGVEGATDEYSDSVMIKKSELKRLYAKIQEYEKILKKYEMDYRALQQLLIEVKH